MNQSFADDRNWPMAGVRTIEIGGVLPTFKGGFERQVWSVQFRESSVA